MATILEALSIAFDHHRSGRLVEAETLYHRILDADPENAAALQLLGSLLAARGDDAAAAGLFRRSLAREPANPDVRFNLAVVLGRLGHVDAATALFRQVLALAPDHAGAWNNFALSLLASGDPDAATPAFRHAVAARPDFAEAWFNLAGSLDGRAPLAELWAVLQEAVARCPGFAPLHAVQERVRPAFLLDLAATLHESGRLEEALSTLRTALPLLLAAGKDPSPALFRGAELLTDLGRDAEAEPWWRRTLALCPEEVAALYALGIRQARAYDYDAARASYERVLRLAPHVAKAAMMLGGVCFEQGDIAAAIAAFRRALDLRPDLSEARSGLLFALSFDEEADPDAVYQEYRRFDALHAAPLATEAVPLTNDRDPGRRLHVGYVSPNFYGHPCGNFVLPVIEQADRAGFAVTCYSSSLHRDAMTEAFERAADRFVLCHGESDAAFAERVRRDRVDILVDCSGHLAGHRLFAFARRAAPVQVGFPLYPDTTGLSAMDYRLMDPHFAPPWADSWHSEALVRLPDAHIVFKPRPSDEVPPADAPVRHRGFVTFGSFNNMSKLGECTVAAWAAILNAAPTARLLLKWRSLGNRTTGFGAATLSRFAAHGVDPSRIDLQGWTADPHQIYREIDLALDPLVANGGTTSCEALWMGVPILTCTGRRVFSRVGTCHLTNIRLTDLIAASPDEYIRLAVELAADPARLIALRQGLRERMAASPLMDAARYTRHLERAYRLMWQRWCTGLPPAPIGPEALRE